VNALVVVVVGAGAIDSRLHADTAAAQSRPPIFLNCMLPRLSQQHSAIGMFMAE
jgi:hypothetical protein